MKHERHFVIVTLVIVILVIVSLTLFVCVSLYKLGQLGGVPGRQNDLFVAIWSDKTNKVAELLSQGADPNGPSNMANHPTPLIDAVSFGRLEIVRLLLSKGQIQTKLIEEDTPHYIMHWTALIWEELTIPFPVK